MITWPPSPRFVDLRRHRAAAAPRPRPKTVGGSARGSGPGRLRAPCADPPRRPGSPKSGPPPPPSGAGKGRRSPPPVRGRRREPMPRRASGRAAPRRAGASRPRVPVALRPAPDPPRGPGPAARLREGGGGRRPARGDAGATLGGRIEGRSRRPGRIVPLGVARRGGRALARLRTPPGSRPGPDPPGGERGRGLGKTLASGRRGGRLRDGRAAALRRARRLGPATPGPPPSAGSSRGPGTRGPVCEGGRRAPSRAASTDPSVSTCPGTSST